MMMLIIFPVRKVATVEFASMRLAIIHQDMYF